MKAKNKRLATILLAAAVGVPFVQTGSVTLYAMENQEALLSDEAAAGSDFQYRELDDGSIKITEYTGSMENVIIPAQIDGKSVTSIGEEAFNDRINLSSIKIPDSVMSIGHGAFSGCSSLSSIEVNINNTNYASENGILYNKDKTELILCLEGKTGDIEIPSSVTSIRNKAFNDCINLSSIKIPDSVTSIGFWAFDGCSSLSSIEVNINNTNYASENDILYNKDKTELILCPEGKTGDIEIPSSVTSIDHWAFDGCSSLSSIEIPSSVTSIGDSVFSGCSSLSSIEIPDSVTSIGDSVFSGCSSLGSIEIPDSVTSIGWYAFEKCSSLSSIKIPSSVTSIGDSVFSGCSSLSSIEIPDSVTNIGEYVFEECSSLSSIEIPDSVTSIEYGAFSGCSSLSNIEIPSSVTSIGDGAFEGCSSNLVIRGEAGSYAQSYASDYDIKFVVLENPGTSNNVTVAKQSYSLTASGKKQTIANLGAKATGGTITYRSNNKSVTVNSQGKVTVAKNFTGTAKITVTAAGAGYQTAAVTVTITVTKAPQSITKAITKKSVKRSAKAQSFKIGARSAGKVTYTVAKKDAKKILTVNREGKVTIKKNAGAGTYTVKVRATAAAKGIYKKTAKTYTIKVTVKK